MDRTAYIAALAELQLTDAELARRLSAAAGYTVRQTTLWRLRTGKTKRINPGLAAYLQLLLKLQRAGIDPP